MKERSDLTTCDICSVKVRADRVERHIQKVHSRKYESFMKTYYRDERSSERAMMAIQEREYWVESLS